MHSAVTSLLVITLISPHIIKGTEYSFIEDCWSPRKVSALSWCDRIRVMSRTSHCIQKCLDHIEKLNDLPPCILETLNQSKTIINNPHISKKEITMVLQQIQQIQDVLWAKLEENDLESAKFEKKFTRAVYNQIPKKHHKAHLSLLTTKNNPPPYMPANLALPLFCYRSRQEDSEQLLNALVAFTV